MIGRFLCWLGWCKLGEPYEFPHEYYEECPEAFGVVLLAKCVRCNSIHRLT